MTSNIKRKREQEDSSTPKSQKISKILDVKLDKKNDETKKNIEKKKPNNENDNQKQDKKLNLLAMNEGLVNLQEIPPSRWTLQMINKNLHASSITLKQKLNLCKTLVHSDEITLSNRVNFVVEWLLQFLGKQTTNLNKKENQGQNLTK
jgi:hypothetical protein